ncbi:hypothetical protein [Chryseosolibacter indicus]|uniref:DUF4876 domain-containing protein n=1 Tax=Chryseosolibacter indicus TaxID=2782351 RepID=A0ABS5VQI4_9BACT|nr:hypothetical protein [Chryseosolibacter indicus]MBT1703697.1 hypothetical protein [Chryseosolibacter indicus]
METPLKYLVAVWLLALVVCLQSCNDQSVQFEKKKIQFTLVPTTSSNGKTDGIDLPENTRLKISIASSNGAVIYSNQEIPVLKVGNGYITDPLELIPGGYTITDFMVVKDSEVLYATPKNATQLSPLVANSLPYNFSVTENSVANVNMQVLDVRGQDPEAFGYASLNVEVINTLAISVLHAKKGQTLLTNATAELRKDDKLIKTIPLNAAVNTIAFDGNPDTLYTLTVFTNDGFKSQTFNFKNLKNELGSNPLQVTLEPALFLTINSYVDEGNENEEYFDFGLEGSGTVNINWGDGDTASESLPYSGLHEYIEGDYTAVITGDLDQITNIYGFSYGSIISAITGLTNLTSLKTYNPSWGAVPIKVDLSNCTQLETINISKYGAPYEPIDLRTDFKLPAQHKIKEFVFDAPSFDINREYISAEELEAMVNNIYNNVTQSNIRDGKFFVNPVVTPSPETQQKLDELQSEYNWEVRFNDEIYDYSESGRIRTNENARRDNWLRSKFPNSKRMSQNNAMAFIR